MRERIRQKRELGKPINTQPGIFFGDQKVAYTAVSNEDPVAEDQLVVAVAVDDIRDIQAIETSIRAELEKQFWFLSPEFQGEELREKFSIQLSDDVATELYNFREVVLTEREIEQIARSLKTYYEALKDKSHWHVKSIQVRSTDIPNPLNGEPYYGMSKPAHHRFELYPASFGNGRYDDDLNISSLEAVVLHEPNHVNFQHEWESNAAALGWEEIHDAILELPGGEKTTWYNSRPEECPTEYAALYPYEDVPESVAIWFLASERLSQVRREMVERLFTREGSSDSVTPQVIRMTPDMPTLPRISVRVTQTPNLSAMFGAVKESTAPAKPIILLDEYRKLRATQK
jgi:hypothetical protein